MTPAELEQEYKRFLRWLVIPQDQKISKKLPLALSEYQKAFKIDSGALNGFYAKETFADDIVEATIQWGKAQTPEMAHALYKRFMSTHNSKDFLAFQSFINKQKEDKGSIFNLNFINPTAQQYEQIVKREASVISGTAIVLERGSEEEPA